MRWKDEIKESLPEKIGKYEGNILFYSRLTLLDGYDEPSARPPPSLY